MLSKFAPGQIWTYENRKHEPNSRVTIVRVDDDPEYGSIIHVHVSKLEIPNAASPQAKITFIAHMPYEEGALAESLGNLESEGNELPDYEEGYQLWREAFENSEAGVFAVSVVEGIEFIEQSLQQ